MLYFHPALPGLWNNNQSEFQVYISQLKDQAGLGFNKLEGPDDSEKCAAEYRACMHNLNTYIPLVCYCHICLMCGRVHVHIHFFVSSAVHIVR